MSTNNSAPGASIHQGLVYIRMYSLQGFGQYDVEYWTWTSSTPQPSTNQNDIGIPNYDLPDTQTLLLSDPNWPMLNSMAPFSSGNAPAQLNPNDTEDWLSITIDSIESIAFEVSYSPSSVNSGTTYINGLTLNLYDAKHDSYRLFKFSTSNSEFVTMNNSAANDSHGGTVYVQIIHVSGYVDYDIQFWTWIFQSGGNNANQNDFGYLNYDLPDTVNDLQADSFWPSIIIGAAPISSGIINAEFSLNGDDNDWLSFALSSNEGLALEISYSSFSFLNSSIVTNDFAVTIYDANFNLIDTSSGNNPEIVTTNNSAAGPGGHGGMIYVHIQRNSGFGIYDIQLWTWFASGGGGSGSGSTGQPVPNPCNDVGVIGSGITVPDILEPNNNEATSSLASILPIYCNGLSFDSPMDQDYFEIQLIAGVTYYVNISFIDANGDIDMEWSAANGAYIDSSTSTGNSNK